MSERTEETVINFGGINHAHIKTEKHALNKEMKKKSMVRLTKILLTLIWNLT